MEGRLSLNQAHKKTKTKKMLPSLLNEGLRTKWMAQKQNKPSLPSKKKTLLKMYSVKQCR